MLRFSPKFPEREICELRLSGKNGRMDGGLNAADLPHTLDTTQSPDCRNVWFYEGTLTKRWGQRMVGALDQESEIQAAILDGTGHAVLQAGTGLFRMNLENGSFVKAGSLKEIEGTAPAGTFFRYGDAVYFLNGAEYLVSNGGDFAPVEPYAPILVRGRSPSGGVEGVTCGSRNALTARYRIAFSGDGSGTVYTLPDGCTVAEDSVLAEVNGVEMPENDGFTVNRANRTVTFAAAPAAGFDNVVLTLTGTEPAEGGDILSCRYAMVHAGESRVMLGGNGSNLLYYSQPYQPTYFPAENRLTVGSDEPITGFGRQYDLLAVFKAHEIATLDSSYAAGTVKFTVNILSPVMGCDMPGTICNIDNRIVFANTGHGICLITSTGRENERNVVPVSRNINPKLLAEPQTDLAGASACCFEGRYWLSVGSHVYLWDNAARPLHGTADDDALRSLAWYFFDNIPAAAFLTYQNRLYYARRGTAGEKTGAVVQFVRQFSDFGEPIAAHWRSAALDFGRPNWYKRLERIWFVCRGKVPGNTAVRYLFDEKKSDVSLKEPVNIRVSSFSWRLFRWDSFTWDVPGYFRTFTRRPQRRRVLFFSMELENRDVSCDLSLADVVVQYRLAHQLK